MNAAYCSCLDVPMAVDFSLVFQAKRSTFMIRNLKSELSATVIIVTFEITILMIMV